MKRIRGHSLERFKHWQGQRLRSSDFRRQQDNSGHQRWWHNRALHSAFGIRFGLHVVSSFDDAGETSLWLECGLAYDCFGRELILPRGRKVELPSRRGEEGARLLLFLQHQDQADRAGINTGRTDGRKVVDEVLSLLWVPEPQSQPSDGVPLALFEFRDNAWREDSGEAGFFAPHTPALARPRLVSGRSLPGELFWEPWTIGREWTGLQTRIDTSAAGFTETPYYFAALNAASAVELPSLEQDLFTHVAQPAPGGFLFRVFAAGEGAERWAAMANFLIQMRQSGLTLCWLACAQQHPELSRCPGVIRRAEPCDCNKEDQCH